MTVKKLCPNCGVQLDYDAVFCTSCGTNINNGPKLPHFIISLNKRMNITSLLIGFAFLGIFIFIFGMLFSFLAYNGSINFIVFLGLTIIFSTFLAGLVIGFIGCNDEKDAIANPTVFLLTILAIILPVFGVSTSISLGVSAAISSAFTGSSYGSTSNYSDTSVGSSFLGNSTLEIVIIVILAILSLFGGCYLGFYLRENVF